MHISLSVSTPQSAIVYPAKKSNYSTKKKLKYVGRLSTTQITFRGRNKNPNQIAVLAAECVPYSVSGGLGAVTGDMTRRYKSMYPDQDLRLFLPFYNSQKEGAPKVDGKPTYLVDGVKNNSSNSILNFPVTDTGIETEFEYGVRKSKAKLYKINNPVGGVKTYLVHVPEFSNFGKQYSLDDFSLFEKYVVFSLAANSLINKMEESKETFNPKILHTKDWHTVYAALKNKDKDLKKVHELLNANSNFHGKIPPFAAALNLFESEQIEKLLNDKKFKKELYQFTINNQREVLNNINTNNLDSDFNNTKFTRKILENIANNYTKWLYAPKNYYSHLELNNAVTNIFKDINWDENQDFNPTVNAIKNTDAWFTISKTHFNELITDATFSSLSLYNMLRLNLNKGNAVLNKIDINRFDPTNPNQIEHTYNSKTYKEGKKRNKNFLFDQFSNYNIASHNFSRKVVNNPDDAIVAGYLDEKYKESPLFVNISRFDTNQKGSDIALDAAKTLLNQNKNICFILALPDIKKMQPDLYNDFVKNVINAPANKGRIVLIDAYVPINQYLAGADFSIIPSRSETCGLVGYQSMRMGAIPIATPVGSMNDCLITPQQDYKKAMGFKTSMHFFKCNNPVEVLVNTLNDALTIYHNEPEQINRMVINAMSYNSDWSTAIKEQKDLYQKLVTAEKINNLSLNDIRNVEDVVDIEMYTQDDIDKLQKADILVALPHSDDEIFFLPILQYLKDGKSVQFVYSSANEKGHYKKGAPSLAEDLAKHREMESLESLNALGIKRNPIKLNIPDLELAYDNNPEIVKKYIEQILDKVQPEKVLTFGPDGVTGNPDHRKLGEIVFNCVKRQNAKNDMNIKLYQAALSDNNISDFNKIMSDVKTDAFDFVSAVPASKIVEKFDVSEYSKQIANSLSKHKSQWSDDEAYALLKYYVTKGVELTSLESYPDIVNPLNPWKERNNLFSNMYGREFQNTGNTIVFQPEGSNCSINLYLSDNDTNKSRIWIENDHFNNPLSGEIPAKIFKSIDKVVKIPKFKDVKYIDYAIRTKNARMKISIPINETKLIAPYLPRLIKDFDYTINIYRRNYPETNISVQNIS